MLQRVQAEGIQLPILYIAETKADVEQAIEAGIPFIKWNRGKDALLREVLKPTLKKIFPYIMWEKIFGPEKYQDNKIYVTHSNDAMEYVQEEKDLTDTSKEKIEKQLEYDSNEIDRDDFRIEDTCLADGYRIFSEGFNEEFTSKTSIEDYVGDLSSHVNVDVLQNLNLLPMFLGDIVDCIKVNLSNSMRWREGYTKKLGMPLGNFGNSKMLPNLIILDISYSIPKGIAATMLTLIDTMRNQLNADLIITSKHSVFYPNDSELPDPQTLRDYFGFGNERPEFFAILENNIKGKEYGHVISFGDYDSCGVPPFTQIANTKVHAVHHYHTKDKESTGYAKWAEECNPDVIDYNTDWCEMICQDDD